MTTTPSKTRRVKRKNSLKKEVYDLIEFDNSEIALMLEAMKAQVKRVHEDRFYRREHPEVFYNIYLERYWRIIEKLDRKLPRAVFLAMPKFSLPTKRSKTKKK